MQEIAFWAQANPLAEIFANHLPTGSRMYMFRPTKPREVELRF